MTSKAAETKDSKETGGAAVAEQEQPAAQPQTAAEIAATEKALGLDAPKPADQTAKSSQQPQTLPAKVPVRMGVAPTTVEEGWRLAQFIAQSELVPKGYRGRPADVLVAIQYGMEVGLPPMAALHSIYVTNGRPSLWGDGFLAVIMAAPQYRDHHEYYIVDGAEKEFLTAADLAKDDTMAVTTFWRRDSERPRTATFSIAKAKKAGLWTKSGPWTEYPDRMLKYRARGFAGHDAFPDVLRGIKSAEEVLDMPPVEQEDLRDPVREVRRISQTPADKRVLSDEDSANRRPGADREDAQAAKGAAAETVLLDPQTVKGVEQFLGGFTITLGNGLQVDTTEVNDASELEKFVGTKHKVRLTVNKSEGTLQLASFAIAD